MGKKKSDDIVALEAAEPVIETVPMVAKPQNSEQENIVPAMTSSEWSDYVMKQFAEDEIFDGNPTVDGLRRIAELLIGEIVESRAHSVAYPGVPRDNCSATVEFTVTFELENKSFKTYTEVADCTISNTDETYRVYPSAMASTRAEGRALRKALKLKRVVAAEEVKEMSAVEEENPAEKIKPSQINYFRIIGRQTDIDIIKFINSGSKTYKNYREIPAATAAKMIAKLSDYKRVMKEIPDGIKGYKADWMEG